MSDLGFSDARSFAFILLLDRQQLKGDGSF